MSYGSNKYGNKKPAYNANSKPQQAPAQPQASAAAKGQGSTTGNGLEFPTPDLPGLNIQVKNGEKYDYVCTVYPYFKKDGSVGYRTSKKAEVNIFIDGAFVVREKKGETWETVGVLSEITNKKGQKMLVPDGASPTPFFASEMKPRD